jgi:transcriptional regulator with XRE-family HTH domain
MTNHDFRRIRHGLLLTQKELAEVLGYAHKIRISEYERETNPVPIPDHIADAMWKLQVTGSDRLPRPAVREWSRHDDVRQ